MSKIANTIKEKRSKLDLIPKHEIIFQVLDRLNRINKGNYSTEYLEFIVSSTMNFVEKLKSCKTEDDIVNLIVQMTNISNDEQQPSRKATLIQLGSMALMSNVVVDYADHDWKEITSEISSHSGIRALNYECAKCHSLGFIPHWLSDKTQIFCSVGCLESSAALVINS